MPRCDPPPPKKSLQHQAIGLQAEEERSAAVPADCSMPIREWGSRQMPCVSCASLIPESMCGGGVGSAQVVLFDMAACGRAAAEDFSARCSRDAKSSTHVSRLSLEIWLAHT